MSAESHLAKFGITVNQAREFILTNIEQPAVIYNTAREFAVTVSMFSEIMGFSTKDISDYFVRSDLDPKILDDTSILINSDLGALENFVDFNDSDGVLSTTSLKEEVLPRLDFQELYGFFFEPPSQWEYQSIDGVYDVEELGITHLGNVPATDESIESLFFGTLLNIYSTIDQDELILLNDLRDSGSLDDSNELLIDALTNTPPSIAWTDEALADLVIVEAANLVNDFFEDPSVVGVLDQSFLGFLSA